LAFANDQASEVPYGLADVTSCVLDSEVAQYGSGASVDSFGKVPTPLTIAPPAFASAMT